MPETFISAPQLKRLQTLWGIHWKTVALDGFSHNVDGAASRLGRLGWIAGVIGRQLESAKELTRSEAITVLDALAKLVPAHLLKKNSRPSRALAREMGNAGRRGYKSKIITPPDARTIMLIAALRAELGMDEARFQAWLRSPHSPTRGQFSLNTMAKANAVISGLKRMVRAQQKKSTLATPHAPLPLEEEVAAT